MVDDIADIHIKPAGLTELGFVSGRAVAETMTSGLVQGIRLRFHDHAPEQIAIVLAFHKPAANQVRGNDLRWSPEEGVGKDWEILGDGHDGYGRGLKTCLTLAQPT